MVFLGAGLAIFALAAVLFRLAAQAKWLELGKDSITIHGEVIPLSRIHQVLVEPRRARFLFVLDRTGPGAGTLRLFEAHQTASTELLTRLQECVGPDRITVKTRSYLGEVEFGDSRA